MKRLRGLREFLLSLTKIRALILIPVLLLFSASPVFPGEAEKDWVETTIKALPLRDKIAQLIQVRVPGKFLNRQSAEFQQIKKQILENRVGGVVLFAGNVYESAILLNELQTLSDLPLIVAADFERGVSFRIADSTSFPWTMAFGAAGSEQHSYNQGLITGREARALGVHWIFAPVLDVNNNPENPVINIRSYGEDPTLVARLGAAFIRGAAKAGVLTTAKHFPGHGDTATDSHIGLPVVESDMSRLNSVELIPFRSAIEAGVDSVMTAHVAVPKLTNRAELPATLSPRILTDLLRGTMKFRGIVVTDALEMGGITNSYWCGIAAVRALQAGADILLLPTNDTVALNEVERAVRRGTISEQRIDESLRRVLNAKARLGLHYHRTVPIAPIADIIASPESARLAAEVADNSITVVRDERRILPVDPRKEMKIFSLVLSSGLESSPGSTFQAEMKRLFPSLRTLWGNARINDELRTSIDRAASESDLIVCSTLSRLSTGQDYAFPSSHRAILKKLIDSRKPLIWIAFGNPYVLRLAPDASTYICTFSYSDVSQVSAAKALAGAIPALGRMPVSIPGLAKAGQGLQIPKLQMTLQTQASGKGFEKSEKLLGSMVASGVFTRAELLAGYKGNLATHIKAEASHPAAAPEREFAEAYRLGSLSRAVATAPAAIMAIDQGLLLPGAGVTDYLPELSRDRMRIRDLLASFGRLQEPALGIIESIISRAAGKSFDRFIGDQLLEPMGLKNTCRAVSTDGSAELSCRAFDIAVIAQMLLDRGIYDHKRYFKPSILASYSGPNGMWSKPSHTEWTSTLFSKSAFGHTSSSGPLLWIDPKKNLFIVLLANAGKVDPEKMAEAQKSIVQSVISEIGNQPSE